MALTEYENGFDGEGEAFGSDVGSCHDGHRIDVMAAPWQRTVGCWEAPYLSNLHFGNFVW